MLFGWSFATCPCRDNFLNEFSVTNLLHDRCIKWCAVKWAGPADASWHQCRFSLEVPCILLTHLNISFSPGSKKNLLPRTLMSSFYLTFGITMPSFSWPGTLTFYSFPLISFLLLQCSWYIQYHISPGV